VNTPKQLLPRVPSLKSLTPGRPPLNGAINLWPSFSLISPFLMQTCAFSRLTTRSRIQSAVVGSKFAIASTKAQQTSPSAAIDGAKASYAQFLQPYPSFDALLSSRFPRMSPSACTDAIPRAHTPTYALRKSSRSCDKQSRRPTPTHSTTIASISRPSLPIPTESPPPLLCSP